LTSSSRTLKVYHALATPVDVQNFVQALLEEEVTELLGCARSARRAAVDADASYRNGHGKGAAADA